MSGGWFGGFLGESPPLIWQIQAPLFLASSLFIPVPIFDALWPVPHNRHRPPTTICDYILRGATFCSSASIFTTFPTTNGCLPLFLNISSCLWSGPISSSSSSYRSDAYRHVNSALRVSHLSISIFASSWVLPTRRLHPYPIPLAQPDFETWGPEGSSFATVSIRFRASRLGDGKDSDNNIYKVVWPTRTWFVPIFGSTFSAPARRSAKGPCEKVLHSAQPWSTSTPVTTLRKSTTSEAKTLDGHSVYLWLP